MGFRENHSTTHQVLRLIENINKGITDRSSTTQVVFLDLEKAFDRTWHQGLIFKLATLNFPLSLLKIIQSFLSNRSIQVRFDKVLSPLLPITAGVPQGSTLSPILFNLYINDIPSAPRIIKYIYADDVTISAESINPIKAISLLNNYLPELKSWLEKWHLQINPKKCTHMTFRNWKKFKQTPSSDNVIFDNTIIPRSNESKFLGIILNDSLSWTSHIKYSLQKAQYSKFKLFPLLQKKSPLSSYTKIRLINSFILPLLTYGSILTFNTPQYNINKIEKFYNRCIRLATTTNKLIPLKEIKKHHQLTSVSNLVAKSLEKFNLSLDNMNNPLLNSIWHYEPKIRKGKHKFKPPKFILKKLIFRPFKNPKKKYKRTLV